MVFSHCAKWILFEGGVSWTHACGSEIRISDVRTKCDDSENDVSGRRTVGRRNS